jgi:hypothetical protein
VVKAHDPYVEAWPELEEIHVHNDLNEVLPMQTW